MPYDSFLLGVKRDPNSPTVKVIDGNKRPTLAAWLDARTEQGWTLVSVQPFGEARQNANVNYPDGELLVILSKP